MTIITLSKNCNNDNKNSNSSKNNNIVIIVIEMNVFYVLGIYISYNA